ncbi:MAG: ATP-binding cassette domain-containing protein [Anaerolineaceae bacterium]|nr:ATP-binding cassette domain-containing protein [Anaerolineaceae bacterium]
MTNEKNVPTCSCAICIENASKSIQKHLVLDNINFLVHSGEFICIHGPNGSGKTMLLRAISGLIRMDSGRIRVFDQEIGRGDEFPRDLGALIGAPGFLKEYSGLYNLELLASIQNRVSREEIIDSIKQVGLNPDDHRPVKTYSTGMLQRLGVAQAIMERPRLLLLDEPTSSLDPDGEEQIMSLFNVLHDEGVTILLVSHDKKDSLAHYQSIYQMKAGSLYLEKTIQDSSLS